MTHGDMGRYRGSSLTSRRRASDRPLSSTSPAAGFALGSAGGSVGLGVSAWPARRHARRWSATNRLAPGTPTRSDPGRHGRYRRPGGQAAVPDTSSCWASRPGQPRHRSYSSAGQAEGLRCPRRPLLLSPMTRPHRDRQQLRGKSARRPAHQRQAIRTPGEEVPGRHRRSGRTPWSAHLRDPRTAPAADPSRITRGSPRERHAFAVKASAATWLILGHHPGRPARFQDSPPSSTKATARPQQGRRFIQDNTTVKKAAHDERHPSPWAGARSPTRRIGNRRAPCSSPSTGRQAGGRAARDRNCTSYASASCSRPAMTAQTTFTNWGPDPRRAASLRAALG